MVEHLRLVGHRVRVALVQAVLADAHAQARGEVLGVHVVVERVHHLLELDVHRV